MRKPPMTNKSTISGKWGETVFGIKAAGKRLGLVPVPALLCVQLWYCDPIEIRGRAHKVRVTVSTWISVNCLLQWTGPHPPKLHPALPQAIKQVTQSTSRQKNKVPENITLNKNFPWYLAEKRIKMPPESSEELTFATGNGEKREEEKKVGL